MTTQNEILELIDHLKQNGVIFAKGLSEEKLREIERIAGGSIPHDLRSMLAIAVPIKDQTKYAYPRWDLSTQLVFDKWYDFFYEMLEFDIREGNFWHPLLGDKPDNIDDALKQARSVISKHQSFIPIGDTRDATVANLQRGLVVDYYGPLETIAWLNLTDFYYHRFPKNDHQDSTDDSEDIPFWSPIFQASYE